MPRATPLRPSFNAGELSPRLAARTDFDKYRNGLEVLENMIPLSEGGVMRRAGTRYVAPTKDGTQASRLKAFKFSTTQAYVLEFGQEYIRFFRNQGRITAGATDATVTNGAFTDGSSGWNDLSAAGGSISHSSSDGTLLFTLTSSSDTAGIDQSITVSSSLVANEHILKFRFKGRPGDKVEVKVGTSSSQADLYQQDKYTGYHCIPFTPNSTEFWPQFRYKGDWRAIDVPSSGSWNIGLRIDDIELISDEILELQSPWPRTQVFDVEGPQSADVLYLMNETVEPYKLTRRGHTEWSLVKVAHQDGPYMDTNVTDTTMQAASTDGRQVTITASTTTGINAGAGFGSSDIDRLIRISTSSAINWGWGIITASTSTTTVTVDVKRDFPSTGATTEWKLGSWSDETGWPGVATFHQQRLFTGRSVDEPQTFWASQTGDFENFSPDSPSSSEWDGTVEDDDGLTYTISSDDVEAIEWMTAGVRLQIGTRGAEWELTSDGPVVTPTDSQVNRHTKHGSARIQPVRIGPATLFVQRAKRRVRGLAFDFERDGLVAPDLTRLSPHITRGGIVEMTYQQEPDSVVWAPRTDGQLLSMTYRPEEDVVAWGRHILGGEYDGGIAQVKSVVTIPGSTASGQTQDSDDRDEVWLLVQRTINGSTVRYVEFMERDYEEGDSQEDSYYSDALLTYDSAATTTLTGSSHLAAATAKIFANGAIHSDKTVSSSGSVSLDISSSTVQVGLGFTHRLKTFKLEAGAAEGTAQGKTKRIPAVTAVVKDALTLNIGTSSGLLDLYDFREVSDPMDTATPLRSVEKYVGLEEGWQTDPRVVIESNDPAPFTLLALIPEVKTNK